MFTINGFIQLSFLLVYSLKMATGKFNRNISIFYMIYRLELLIPPSNTMLKLLDILFVIKLHARINTFCRNFTFVGTFKDSFM